MAWITGESVVLTELLGATFILTVYQPRRRHFALRLALALAVSYGVVLLDVLPGFAPLRYSIVYLLTFGSIWFCFAMNGWSALYWGTAGLIVQHAGYSAISVLAAADYTLQFSLPVTAAVFAVLYAAEYIGITRRTRRDPLMKSQHKALVLVSLAVILLNVVLHSLRNMYTTTENVALNGISSVYALCCCFLELALLLGMFQKEQLLDELGIVRRLWADDKKQFEMARQNTEQLNILCHDLKHVMRNPAWRDTAYGQKMARTLQDLDTVVTTDNHVLNVILTEKSLFCSRNHIKLTCMADGADLSCIDTTDLYSMFGNLIDNAVEAVAQLPDPARRVIALTMRRSGQLQCIHIENYFAGTLHFADGLPQTTKEQAAYHGFGLKSVRLLAEKYGGSLTVGTKDDMFYGNLLLPLPAQPAQTK